MANVTRWIGLSLGADICWPQCFEDIIRNMDLELPIKRDKVRFEVERVTIEPFDLMQPVKYDVVLDRLTHWYHTSREWIKKAVLLDGTYVLNNPWSIQSMEKQTSYCAMMKLGLHIPKTMLIPPKEYEDTLDLQMTLAKYAKMFDLEQIGEKVGYPSFMKPYDGGGWRGVSKLDNFADLRKAYEESGRFVMHLQQGIVPYDIFVRGIGIGPQIRVMKYDPSVPLHERYQKDVDFLDAEQLSEIEDITLTINSFFGWDFNSAESLLKGGTWYPIDFANPCPDSQITSLHCHFPWYVIAKIRWAIFCAATKRKFQRNLNWQPFFEIAKKDLPYREKLSAYADIARKRFETDKFEEFCAKHLSDLDEIAWDYFGTERCKAAVSEKVRALYPEHEWDEFTELFWNGIQIWRERETPEEA